MLNDYFYKNGEMKCSYYQMFCNELSLMKEAFEKGDKEKALEHENNCGDAIFFAGLNGSRLAVNDMEYELYKASDYTQLNHPKRTLKTYEEVYGVDS